MASSLDFVEFICEQIHDTGEIRFRKMFGEYIVYVNDKPLLLVCDDTVFVKILPETAKLMSDCETGFPYDGAKEHYILDIDNADFAKEVIEVLKPIIPVPKPKKKKINKGV
jgi:TfoX/Sxy family transcriptional regulator of competence genes